MSRPREHNEYTAAALLEAAERLAEGEGIGGLSVRRVAQEIGTTTRAVYSLFGSKDGLVMALGVRAFNLLGEAVAGVPETSDPALDVVRAGLEFRRFAQEHPAFFQIAIQRIDVSGEARSGFSGAGVRALAVLQHRLTRLGEAGQLGDRSIPDVTWEFHALCEGLAALEARCFMQDEEAERLWRDALSALVRGWSPRDSSPMA